MSKQKKADFMLLLVTLFWGASYYMIDISLRDLQPMMLNAVRFLVAFALMGAVFFNKIKSVSKKTLKYAGLRHHLARLLPGQYHLDPGKHRPDNSPITWARSSMRPAWP